MNSVIMNSIMMYKDMEHWGKIFGISTKEIDTILEKYNSNEIFTSRRTNLEVLINVCRTDYID